MRKIMVPLLCVIALCLIMLRLTRPVHIDQPPYSLSPVGTWRLANSEWVLKPDSSGSYRLTTHYGLAAERPISLHWNIVTKDRIHIQLQFRDGGLTEQYGTLSADGNTLTIDQQVLKTGWFPILEQGEKYANSMKLHRQTGIALPRSTTPIE